MEYELIAPCHFGLEACTKAEIADLGYKVNEVSDGKVTFTGDERAICESNIFLRTAERVLIKVAEFKAVTWEELFDKVYNIDWARYLPRDANVWVAKAASIKSTLFSPRDFQTIIQKAIIKKLQASYHISGRLAMSGADYALRVTAYKDIITIGIDSSGESLHKRGYRFMTVKAPITETLAAALLMLTTHDKTNIIADPFCGSGTFLIEEAMMRLHKAPGMERSFAACKWANLIDKKHWHETYDKAREIFLSGISNYDESTRLIGRDISPEAISYARGNAGKAGVNELIDFNIMDVRDFRLKGEGSVIITNPPYGERIGETSELFPLYRELGRIYREADKCRMYVISGYEESTKAIGLKPAKNRKIYNGMMKTYFYTFKETK